MVLASGRGVGDLGMPLSQPRLHVQQIDDGDVDGEPLRALKICGTVCEALDRTLAIDKSEPAVKEPYDKIRTACKDSGLGRERYMVVPYVGASKWEILSALVGVDGFCLPSGDASDPFARFFTIRIIHTHSTDDKKRFSVETHFLQPYAWDKHRSETAKGLECGGSRSLRPSPYLSMVVGSETSPKDFSALSQGLRDALKNPDQCPEPDDFRKWLGKSEPCFFSNVADVGTFISGLSQQRRALAAKQIVIRGPFDTLRRHDELLVVHPDIRDPEAFPADFSAVQKIIRETCTGVLVLSDASNVPGFARGLHQLVCDDLQGKPLQWAVIATATVNLRSTYRQELSEGQLDDDSRKLLFHRDILRVMGSDHDGPCHCTVEIAFINSNGRRLDADDRQMLSTLLPTLKQNSGWRQADELFRLLGKLISAITARSRDTAILPPQGEQTRQQAALGAEPNQAGPAVQPQERMTGSFLEDLLKMSPEELRSLIPLDLGSQGDVPSQPTTRTPTPPLGGQNSGDTTSRYRQQQYNGYLEQQYNGPSSGYRKLLPRPDLQQQQTGTCNTGAVENLDDPDGCGTVKRSKISEN